MKKDEEIDKRSQLEILRELDIARTDASLHVCQIQEILKLCDNVAISLNPGKEIDWLPIIMVLADIASETQRDLDRTDVLTTLAQRKNPDYMKEHSREFKKAS